MLRRLLRRRRLSAVTDGQANGVRPALQRFGEERISDAEYDRWRTLRALRELAELAVVYCEVGPRFGAVAEWSDEAALTKTNVRYSSDYNYYYERFITI